MPPVLDNYFKLETQLTAEHGGKVALWILHGEEYSIYGWRLDNNCQWHTLGIVAEFLDLRLRTVQALQDEYADLQKASVPIENFAEKREMLLHDGWTVHCVCAANLELMEL